MPAPRTRRRLAYLLLAALTAAPGALAQSADPYAEARALFSDQKYAEAGAAYAALAAKNPYDGSLAGSAGYSLHAAKRWEEAIPYYKKAIELGQNPGPNTYNWACALSLLGRKDEALAMLEKALDNRFVEQETLENDTDMDPVRDDPRFAVLTGITKGLKTPVAANRDDGWKWDLDFYARRMKQMHWDLYTKVPEKSFQAELAKLKADIPKLSDNQARARLRKITAMVGDGHTASGLSPDRDTTRQRLPVHLYSFKDGLYILGAADEHKSLVGCKVLKIGPLPVDAALLAVRPYICVDNDMGYLDQAPSHLTVPAILQAIGASADENGAVFTLAPAASSTSAATNSTPTTLNIKPVEVPSRGHGGILTPGYTYAHQSLKETPLYLKDLNKILQLEEDPTRRLVYFGFRGIADDHDVTVADFCTRLFDTIEKTKAEHLVIDMRFNGGGNTGLVRPLITGVAACKAINCPGHLWVIIGRRTFSAAQNTVNLMNSFARPIFVGEPTGSRPRFIGESTWFMLPHSNTRVYCSSRYWQVMDSTDDRCWVPPQIAAEMTYADYAAGRDPAMEAIYAAIGQPPTTTGASSLSK